MSPAAIALLDERRQLESDFAARKVTLTGYAREAGRIQRKWDALDASDRTF